MNIAPIVPRCTAKTMIKRGEYGFGFMPWSEVCMHMKVSDKLMLFQYLDSGMVQLYKLNGSKYELFSFPITSGEAGIYGYGDEAWYYFSTPSAEHIRTILIVVQDASQMR